MNEATGLTAAHLRVARPTDDLDAVVRFYRDGLGFEVVGGFTGHDGFDGAMLDYRVGVTWSEVNSDSPAGINSNCLLWFSAGHQPPEHRSVCRVTVPRPSVCVRAEW